MFDDNSNDVVVVEDNEETSRSSEGTSSNNETRPIMQLFQRLINNDSKQNTVLTNAQIISILHKEFDIDITTLHELEMDIYLNLVKKFLKNWPQWDEFDRGINNLRKRNAHSVIKDILETKYEHLKKYLKVHLDYTRPLAQESVRKVVEENSKIMEQVDTSDVVIEISCTRKQLNQLICSRPNPSMGNNIFNLVKNGPTSISVNNLPWECILNWWGVQVTIELKSIFFSRTTMHQLKHVLVNSKNGPRNLKQVLNNRVQIKKENKRQTEDFNKQDIYIIFDTILKQHTANQILYNILQSMFNLMKSDIEIIDGAVKVPATYRQHSNPYPYYRKLRKEVTTMMQKPNLYNLYLEETISPMHVFHIGKIGNPKSITSELSPTWLTVECMECKTKFNSIDFCSIMKEHFDMYHTNEPDWTCTNCERTFTMTFLAQNRWHHVCESG